ncbi:MAG: Zn-dependent hydrolase [Acidimicrobiia bacterium]|nr:Zn-dependent hydrolase [Acidimicrobiia bacterium]
MSNRVDGERLWGRLMAMAEVAPTANGGSNRQALSDDDAAGRSLFLEWATAAGCTSELDEVGNLFVRRPGLDDDLPAVLIGSHLDTQPTGGRFDGVYGVLGGLEVIERLNDLDLTTDHPIELVVWTNEEGSRFQHSMMGSAVWAGKLSLAAAEKLTDLDGTTVAAELDRLGWRGLRPARPRAYAAAFELHIEQGPILEAEAVEIGVVNGVQGLRWFTIELCGFPAHAGPTPMVGRRDPARAIAGIIDRVYGVVDDFGPWGRGTFAQFSSSPVSPNTIPEQLICSLDLRHPDEAALDEMEERTRTIVDDVAGSLGVAATITKENDSPPVAFDPACIAAVQASVDELGFTNRQMVSGAGHDACYVAAHCPTSMIFVPCDDGLSHNEAENIDPSQAEQGASVLLGAVRRMATRPSETS